MAVPQKFYRGDDASPGPRAICRRAQSPASLPISDTERQEERRQEIASRQERIEVLRRQVAAGKQIDFARASRQLAGLEPWDDVELPPVQRRKTSRWIPGLSERIRELRTRRGWTKADLGREAGMDSQVCGRVELYGSGKLETIRKIASALGVSLEWLLTGEESCRKAA